jgi:hypothetical protein
MTGVPGADAGRAGPSTGRTAGSSPTGGSSTGPTATGASSRAVGNPTSTTTSRSTAPRGAQPEDPPTTVLPSGAGRAADPSGSTSTEGTPVPSTPGGATARPTPARTVPPRPVGRSDLRPSSGRTPQRTGRSRRARLSLRRIDPWSVFVFTLVASIFVGIALVVAVAALFSVLGSLGVTGSVNELFSEVTGGLADNGPLLTFNRVVGGAAVLAALNIVFLTLLATLSALLYNLCASFTGGIELTLGDDD